MPDPESIHTAVARRKGDRLYKGAKEARKSPGIPLGRKKVTPEAVRVAWASRDDAGRRLLAVEIGIEAIVRAHQRGR